MTTIVRNKMPVSEKMKPKQMTLANRDVLVLNKSWKALRVADMEYAMNKLCGTYDNGSPKAVVVDGNTYQRCAWHPEHAEQLNIECWQDLRPAHDEECMRSAHTIFRIPEVIQLMSYNGIGRKPGQVKYNRRQIFRRDDFRCQYCGVKPPHDELSVDHVIPRCQGGETVWQNIVLSCVSCNARKAGRTPKEAGMKLLSTPKKPSGDFVITPSKMKASWKNFIDSAYWNVELENDNKD